MSNCIGNALLDFVVLLLFMFELDDEGATHATGVALFLSFGSREVLSICLYLPLCLSGSVSNIFYQM